MRFHPGPPAGPGPATVAARRAVLLATTVSAKPRWRVLLPVCGTLIASDFADPLWHNAQRLGSACCADAFAGFRAAMIMRAAAAPRQKCKADYGSDQPAYLAAVGHPDYGAFIRFGRFCPSLWRVARRFSGRP